MLAGAAILLIVCNSALGGSGYGASEPHRIILNRRSTKFVLLFGAVILAGFAVVAASAVQSHVIGPLTAKLATVSSALLRTIGHEVSVVETTIFSPHFSVDIRNGCNGVEAILILVAAIVAFPAPWRSKVTGVVVGTVALEAINVVRISSLYLLGYYNREIFDLFHSAVWQVGIILVSLGIFAYWSGRVSAKRKLQAAV